MISVRGIGIDVVMNNRIERMLSLNHRDRFLEKALHQKERDIYYQKKSDKNGIKSSTSFVASRWAAKEAIYKALNMEGVLFNEILVLKGERGAPVVEYTGKTKDLVHQSGIVRTLVSISTDGNYTVANALV
eukprot:TRINITY_DN8616_c0_g1_i1.p1 TRINITY_DN8616_c0_g1~~TRINITY_DN8616_c0_g1_i1.p1  ORF type:complete len:147 (+),score=31.01 TRINITY_DN8616_c0_g1_i1:50-442(+)